MRLPFNAAFGPGILRGFLAAAILLSVCPVHADAAATALWGEHGVSVTSNRSHGSQLYPDIAGYRAASYGIYRFPVSGVEFYFPVYNKFNQFGRMLWANDRGMAESIINIDEGGWSSVAAPNGGTYFVYYNNIASGGEMRYQLVDAAGDRPWVWEKVLQSMNSYKLYLIGVANDTAGNLFVLYTVCHINGAFCLEYNNLDGYVAKILPDGTVAFNNLLPTKVLRDNVGHPFGHGVARIVPDQQGGVLAVWAKESSNEELMMMRYDAGGGRAPGWPVGGKQIYQGGGAGGFTNEVVASPDGFIYFRLHLGGDPPGPLPPHPLSLYYLNKTTFDATLAPGWPGDGKDTAIFPSGGYFRPDGSFFFIGNCLYLIDAGVTQGLRWPPSSPTPFQYCFGNGNVQQTRLMVDGNALFLVWRQGVNPPPGIWTYVEKFVDGARAPGWGSQINVLLLEAFAPWTGWNFDGLVSDGEGGIVVQMTEPSNDGAGFPSHNVVAQRINEANIPLQALQVLCRSSLTTPFQQCANMQLNDVITAVEVECTDADYGIDRASLQITNPASAVVANGFHTAVNGNFYILDGLSVPVNLVGQWYARGTCYGLAGESATANVIWPVAGPNLPPVANAGLDQQVPDPGSVASLDGSASYDPDGIIVKYEWSSVAALPAGCSLVPVGLSDPRATLTCPSGVGPAILQLKVTDDDDTTGTDDVTVTFAPLGSNTNPMAVANVPANGWQGEVRNIVGSGSHDNEDLFALKSYAWSTTAPGCTFGNTAVADTTLSCDAPGLKTITLTVTDWGLPSGMPPFLDGQASSQYEVLNRPPAAVVPDDSILAPGAIVLDGSGSSDPDGDSITYAWSFVPGASTGDLTLCNLVPATMDQSTLDVTCPTPRVLAFQLTVTDDHAASGTDLATASFTAANTAPAPTATNAVGIPGDTLTLSSFGNDVETPNNQLVFAWTPNGAVSDCTYPDGMSVQNLKVTCTTEGVRTFSLIVTDPDGLTGSASASASFFTVLPTAPPNTQSSSALLLSCPRITPANETNVTVQCLNGSTGGACDVSQILLTGAPNVLRGPAGSIGFVYSVDTRIEGDYNLLASVAGIGESGCRMTRVGVNSSSVPDVNPVIAVAVAACALLIARRRRGR
ncbi:MAG: hypothetical protein V1708_05980 [Candidatus Micrarchaeota archaeon]